MIVSKSLLKRLLSEPLRAVDRATLHAVPLGKCSLCYITFVGYCGYKPLCRLGSRNVVKCVLEFLDRDFVETTPDVFRKFWADSSNDGYRSTSTAWARSHNSICTSLRLCSCQSPESSTKHHRTFALHQYRCN